MSRRKSIYKVSFINQGKVYEVFAQKVYQADLYGFVVIEQLIFGERSTVVVDPGEERLKSEFASVRRSFVPMHAIIRIDEVEKEGVAKIHELGANITAFPPTLPPPGGRRDG
ncbi:DUF1820 family protein [Thioalkalivibrio sulfidiphilus]|uniref:DUF1820 family protein n=1 Tax=Thioalkalivibrio sulfidiphilus TaxID=1033854 RepID=UPI00036C63C8|nr:DUF1820 family protein [Thioalkalivibrio sulfidiphilus]